MTSSTSARFVTTYVGLVVLPVVAAIVLLNADIGAVGEARSVTGDAHPLARLLLAIAAVVCVCKCAGAVARRLGQPSVIGEIAGGILLGPSVLGTLWPAGREWLIPDNVLPQLNVLAQVGVVLFVFLAGLELNIGLLRGRGQLAIIVSHVSIAGPFLIGVLLAVFAYQRFAPAGVGYLPFALFLGLSMSVTALPVLARILIDLGMNRSRIGVLVMTCALVDDVTAWTLLALVVAVVGASSVMGVIATIALTAGFVALLCAIRPMLAQLIATTEPMRVRIVVQLVLVGVLLSAATAEWIGVHAIFGAFIFGLILPGGSRDGSPGLNKVADRIHSTVGNLTTMLLLPLFFAYSGLRTDLVLLGADVGLWLWCGLILVISMAGKLGGSALAARAVGSQWSQAWQIGALMNCRGLTELVVLNIGLDLGILDPALFAILVLMALLSTAMAAPIVRRFRSLDATDSDVPKATLTSA